MATINFYLDKPNSVSETMIFMRTIVDSKRIKIYTGEKILPKNWNPNKQEVRKAYSGSDSLNRLLQSMRADTESIIRDAKSLNIEISTEYLKEQFERNFKKNKFKTSSFFEQFNLFIETCKTQKKPSVIKAYKTTFNQLHNFENLNNIKLSFELMDTNFYDKFMDYLLNNKKFLNNTAGNYIKHLKTFLNFCYQRKINPKDDFKKFKALKEEVQTIYLTEEELNKISTIDLKDNDKLNHIRNIFLIQCYTGLRYSDLINLRKENFKNDFIILETLKTKDSLRIPIVPRLKKLLDEYPDYNFRFISNQKMNSYLKELGWRAEITEPTQILSYRGAERIEKTVPKYELISTHTARRSFVTLSLEKGMRAESVMKVTGHTDMTSFKKYIKLTDKVLEAEMQNVWK
ncbi:MAG: site-specific integrase [Bacteroidota bacterium]